MQYEKQPNLSSELQSTIRSLIVFGELAGGEQINEVRLAEQLGVSRTPLREAQDLARLLDGFSGGVLVAQGDTILLHEAYGLADFESGQPNLQ